MNRVTGPTMSRLIRGWALHPFIHSSIGRAGRTQKWKNKQRKFERGTRWLSWSWTHTLAYPRSGILGSYLSDGPSNVCLVAAMRMRIKKNRGLNPNKVENQISIISYLFDVPESVRGSYRYAVSKGWSVKETTFVSLTWSDTHMWRRHSGNATSIIVIMCFRHKNTSMQVSPKLNLAMLTKVEKSYFWWPSTSHNPGGAATNFR